MSAIGLRNFILMAFVLMALHPYFIFITGKYRLTIMINIFMKWIGMRLLTCNWPMSSFMNLKRIPFQLLKTLAACLVYVAGRRKVDWDSISDWEWGYLIT